MIIVNERNAGAIRCETVNRPRSRAIRIFPEFGEAMHRPEKPIPLRVITFEENGHIGECTCEVTECSL